MEKQLEQICATLLDAGCTEAEIRGARSIYQTGNRDALLRYLRKCRCGRMEELHESQRRVDRLDYLIRQTQKNTKLPSL